ncbi:transcription/translation regulatory transformer protein RfaH [Pseudomonas sp. WN033]|nr:transcription/translation regulatory transformer protein RfaH [Pseudomonas sp. WN033]
MSNTAGSEWYLIQCKPRQEARAEENLRKQNFSCLLPLCWTEKIRHGKSQMVQEPLFPGYLFINLCQLTDSWYSIRSTRGVRRLVTFGNMPVAVPAPIIDGIQQRLTQVGLRPLFQQGDKVVITSGPLKDLTAIFGCRDGEERAVILLSMLQREQAVKIRLGSLKSIA